MKKFMRFMCLAAALSSMPVFGANYDFTVDSLNYKVDLASHTLTLVSGFPQPDGSVTVPDAVNYKNVDWPVVEIGNNAFYLKSNVKSLKLGKNVTKIGGSSFYDTGLKKIEWNDATDSIFGYAFSFTSLHSVILPNSVKYIGKDAFNYCYIDTIVLSSSLTEIPSGTFYRQYYTTANVTIPENIKLIEGNGFNADTVNIEPGDTLLLSGSSNGTSKSFGDNVVSFNIQRPIKQYIKREPFYGLFFQNDALKNLNWNANRVIPEYTFNRCPNIETVSLHNVDSLGVDAFGASNQVKIFNCYTPQPPKCTNRFPDGMYVNAALHVPEGCGENYRNDVYWKDFLEIIDDLKGDVSINDIEIESEINPIYYNLQGQRIQNPQHGIYIKKQGNRTVKVMR